MKAEYIDHMGDDLRVTNAARVSFDKESDWDYENYDEGGYGKLKDKDAKLIRYLADHDHFTPFTHPQITMRETVPIFIARQRFKHVVGFTYNEMSRRYVDTTPEFYMPDVWRKRAENKKQGSSEEVVTHFGKHFTWDGWEETFKEADSVNEAYDYFVKHAEFLYNSMLESGICPEQARMILPQSMMTSYYVTGSLAAWARAYKLRSDSHAQKEIRDLAAQWNEIIEPLFPVSWKELTK